MRGGRSTGPGYLIPVPSCAPWSCLLSVVAAFGILAVAAQGEAPALGGTGFLDATIVRLVLPPVAVRLVGPASWWIPRWLDHILPDAHADAVPRAGS